ncbi:ABC transporter ATP-binding protein [Enterococcus avium]|uniref:ABC transporter ATP-binding protein n=1 Tax=Enterococcus malodoratus TaxID=71451 RepID=UPI0008D8BBF0|nr:ABC transporter ATP-binding protein [Enterococcus malodoratus]BBM17851.1 ABC transporter ATP-binding protein [Enterococcus avium]SET39456.1 putative ABC transport system ATP-binding protein [Enterococcus malodoratus]
MNTLINGTDIVKSFGEGTEKVSVLNQVSIQVQKGQFVSIMGPSGSGKSTLLYAISGMDRIDSGTVVFNQQPLVQMIEKQLADIRREQMGFVFQQPTLLKNLSLIDNIILPSLSDKKMTDKLTKHAENLMESVGIKELKDRKITQVSGGQLQRAGICRALMSQPSIIFGDEPTGALNSKAAQEIMDILLKINEEGTTIVIVTHDAKVAAQSEQVFFMEDGQIEENLFLGKYSGQNLETRIEKINEKVLAVET